MNKIATGENAHHKVYGKVEVSGFTSVSDEIEINEVEKNGSTHLDVVCSVQTDYVQFLDDQGREHQEPLEQFYENAKISS